MHRVKIDVKKYKTNVNSHLTYVKMLTNVKYQGYGTPAPQKGVICTTAFL